MHTLVSLLGLLYPVKEEKTENFLFSKMELNEWKQKKNLLVVCKVALRTIILRDNIIREHWRTINNITYMLQLRYNKSNMVI